MAAITQLGQTFTTASGTKTVTATPAVGDLIVIVTAHTGNTSAATPTDDNSSGTYVTFVNSKKATSADTLMIHVRTALIGAANSTIFSHAPGASTGGGLAVFKITGMSRVGWQAFLQAAKQENQAGATTPAPAFGYACDTTNPILGAVFNGTNTAGVTQPTGYSEDTEGGYNTPPSGLETVHRDSGETGTTITWQSTSASAFCDAIIELNATAIPTFPTTGVLTNFTGADESPLSEGGAWNGPINTGGQELKRASNACQTTAAGATDGSEVYATSFGANQEVFVTLTTVGTVDNDRYGVHLRTTPGGTASHYMCRMTRVAGAWNWELSKYVSGGAKVVILSISANPGPNLANGDLIGARIDGSYFEGWHKPAAGAWTVILSAKDGQITGSGKLALELRDTTAITTVADDFGGGAIFTFTKPPVITNVNQAPARGASW